MPTQEHWVSDTIAQTAWTAPLTPDDLRACFGALAKMIDQSDKPVSVLFEITNTGTVPAQAPVLAIRSGFMKKADKIAVVGMDVIPQVLAQVAVSMTNKEITFFPLYDSAIAFLNDD